MTILVAKEKHIPIISEIARKTWFDVYSNILSAGQIEYMLEMMYSTKSLKDQMTNLSHHFLLVKSDNEYVGFISYETDYGGESKTKIHKLYVSPTQQKRGLGKLLIDEVSKIAIKNSNYILSLNMNKSNNAVNFYQKTGFCITKEECNDIGNGYVMDDYVLEKQLAVPMC